MPDTEYAQSVITDHESLLLVRADIKYIKIQLDKQDAIQKENTATLLNEIRQNKPKCPSVRCDECVAISESNSSRLAVLEDRWRTLVGMSVILAGAVITLAIVLFEKMG